MFVVVAVVVDGADVAVGGVSVAVAADAGDALVGGGVGVGGVEVVAVGGTADVDDVVVVDVVVGTEGLVLCSCLGASPSSLHLSCHDPCPALAPYDFHRPLLPSAPCSKRALGEDGCEVAPVAVVDLRVWVLLASGLFSWDRHGEEAAEGGLKRRILCCGRSPCHPSMG